MANPAKAKGDRAERAFVAHVAAWWPNVRRGKAGGEKDLGDVFGIVDRDGDPWTVQVADRTVLWRELGKVESKAFEAAMQAERAGTLLWCLVVKRPGVTDVDRWLVYLPAWALWGQAPRPAPLNRDGYDAWDDLAHVTVRTWLALVAPEPAWTPGEPF